MSIVVLLVIIAVVLVASQVFMNRRESKGSVQGTGVRTPRHPIVRILLALILLVIVACFSFIILDLASSPYRRMEYRDKAPGLFLIDLVALSAFVLTIRPWIHRKRKITGAGSGPSESNGSTNSENAAEPDSSGDRQMVVGAVGGFQARSEEKGKGSNIVWTFRIERFDAEGNRLPPVPVQMKAKAFNGFVTDGDRIRVNTGGWKPGKLLSPKAFYNETTQSEVRVEGGCFIATAAFGDLNDNSVQYLRSYRDTSLNRNAIGRAFVLFYYTVSPVVASLVARSEPAKRVIRVCLRLVIRMLVERQLHAPKSARHD